MESEQVYDKTKTLNHSKIIANIIFYLSLAILLIYAYGYFVYGVGSDFLSGYAENFSVTSYGNGHRVGNGYSLRYVGTDEQVIFNSQIAKDIVSYLDITNNQASKYYVFGLIISTIMTFITGLITKKFNFGYMFLIGSFIFGFTAYKVEVVRIGFIFPTIIFFIVFLIFGLFPQLADLKTKRLKKNGIKVLAKLKEIKINYSYRMNGVPAKKLIVEVNHPLDGKKVVLESSNIFNTGLTSDSLESDIEVYFDRYTYNSYFIYYKVKKEESNVLKNSMF